jgi:Family of unknown function (DUF6444)
MERAVTDEMLAAWPPEAQATVRLLLNQVAELKAEVAEPKSRLAKDSTNSSRPPSAMHPHAKPSKQSIRKATRRAVRLEWHRYRNGVSWFEAKWTVIRDAVRAYIANPLYNLPHKATT